MNSKLALSTGLLVGATLLAVGPGYATVEQLPMGHPVDAAGVQAACTGASIGARAEPRWRNYSARFEAVGGYGQYLGNELLSVRKLRGGTFVQVSCEGPWVLMQLKPGRYAATMQIADAPEKHVRFSVPDAGQRDVIIRFPSRMAGRPIGHLAANEQAHTNL